MAESRTVSHAPRGRRIVARIRDEGSHGPGTDLTFGVEPARIRFFAEFLERRPGLGGHVIAAQELASSIAPKWAHDRIAAERALAALNVLPWLVRCLVSVLPADFAIGASNTSDNVILYGQPERGPGFASALIAHELAHIGLARRASASGPGRTLLSPLSVEVLCFLTEAHVHLEAGRRRLLDIWPDTELDDFHRRALEVAVEIGDDIVQARALAAERGSGSVEARVEAALEGAGEASKPVGLLCVLRAPRATPELMR